jgi:hypothetical protein
LARLPLQWLPLLLVADLLLLLPRLTSGTHTSSALRLPTNRAMHHAAAAAVVSRAAAAAAVAVVPVLLLLLRRRPVPLLLLLLQLKGTTCSHEKSGSWFRPKWPYAAVFW